MLRRWRHLLCWCSTLATLVAAAEDPQLHCDRSNTGSAATDTEVVCWSGDQFRMRMRHTPAQPGSGSDGGSLLFFCDASQSRPDDYAGLQRLNLSLGHTETVVLEACRLPAQRRMHSFLATLGVSGVRTLKINSHSLLNDTMPAEFLVELHLRTLRLDSLSRLELHDDFLRSAVNLRLLTITGTRTALPAGLLRHTPGLRRLALYKLDSGDLDVRLLHGLRNLTMLVLGRNKLQAVSREHFRDLQQLERLDLYQNQLETLSADVLTPLVNLQVLVMESNPLKSLPETLFAGNRHLKELRLNGGFAVSGDVGALPEGLFAGLDQLELLTLDRLGLRSLPEAVFRPLVSLRNLTLDHNPLGTLPGALFAGLVRLRNIDLRAADLTALPDGLFHGLTELDTLYLNNNKLTELPNFMFRSTPHLGRLYLQNNRIASVGGQTFSGLRNSLWLLNMANNSMPMLTSAALQELGQVRELHLQYNNITEVSDALRINLLRLKRLDLRYNQLTQLGMAELNFLTRDADILMQHNRIRHVRLQPVFASSTGPANRIHIGHNPFRCDCAQVMLKDYIDRTGDYRDRTQMDSEFILVLDDVRCAGPAPFNATLLADVPADELVCALDSQCPAACRCFIQPSRRLVITDCQQLPTAPVEPLRPPLTSYSRSLRVRHAGLRRLTDLTAAPVTQLDLSHNALQQLQPRLLPDGLRQLRLNANNISHVGDDFVQYLSRPDNNGTRVWLADNPLLCDCALLPFHQHVQLLLSERSWRVADAAQLRCSASNQTLVSLRADQLCPTSTATIVAACLAALAVTALLLAAALVYYRHGERIRVFLYSRQLCLWLVTEEELDADKRYDAFISYSHKDEEFVLEQLVKPLEQGEPAYALCLHFRDWLAGEWITDQIQRSVEDSRRVLIVMSQNFIQSEWGRLEFLAAHKQALNDQRNRLIVIVYGELPPAEQMDPELRLYISSNTYLRWGESQFWERLRYALPHRGRRLKQKPTRRRTVSEKLSLMSRQAAPATSPSDVTLPPDPAPPAGPLPGPTNNGHAHCPA